MDVIRTLKSDLTATTAAGGSLRRRRQPRVGVRLRLLIRAGGRGGRDGRDSVAVAARLRDLGPRGVGLLTDREMPVGGDFVIELPRELGGVAHLMGRVERCRRVGGADALYEVGATLRPDAPRDEVRRFLRAA